MNDRYNAEGMYNSDSQYFLLGGMTESESMDVLLQQYFCLTLL